MEEQYNWPGWLIRDNPHGKEFDLEARKRMVRGSKLIVPLIKRYCGSLGPFLLEAGPFFEPLITPKNMPDKRICYVDNDSNVLSYLQEKYPSTFCIYHDLNQNLERIWLQLEGITNIRNISFSGIVASQVFNYIDYRAFLRSASRIIEPRGFLFVNHSRDYGLPKYFSKLRPSSDLELLEELDNNGFEIVEKQEIPTQNPEHQNNVRLLLVLRKN